LATALIALALIAVTFAVGAVVFGVTIERIVGRLRHDGLGSVGIVQRGRPDGGGSGR
jgi:hypothetical protein